MNLAHHYRTRELVHRAYVRACKRREREAAGFPPDGPVDENEAWRRRFEDVIYDYVHRHDIKRKQFRVLAGGAGGSLSGERRPPQEEVGQAHMAARGSEPPVVPDEERPGHPTDFYFDRGDCA